MIYEIRIHFHQFNELFNWDQGDYSKCSAYFFPTSNRNQIVHFYNEIFEFIQLLQYNNNTATPPFDHLSNNLEKKWVNITVLKVFDGNQKERFWWKTVNYFHFCHFIYCRWLRIKIIKRWAINNWNTFLQIFINILWKNEDREARGSNLKSKGYLVKSTIESWNGRKKWRRNEIAQEKRREEMGQLNTFV